MARSVLVIGIGPALMAESQQAFPTVDAEAVRAGLAKTREQLDDMGFEMVTCRLESRETADAVLREQLAARRFDAVVVGGGIRMDPAMTTLFETVVNTVHRAAPDVTFCFNTSPAATADAVARWFPAAGA